MQQSGITDFSYYKTPESEWMIVAANQSWIYISYLSYVEQNVGSLL